MSASELAQIARTWGAGNRAFKKAFETDPADPVTHFVNIRPKKEFLEDKSPEAQEIREAIDSCDALDLVKYVQEHAAEKVARYARFQIVLCLGEELLKQKEKAELAVGVKIPKPVASPPPTPSQT